MAQGKGSMIIHNSEQMMYKWEFKLGPDARVGSEGFYQAQRMV